MAKKPNLKPSPATLRKAYKEALSAAWHLARKKHPADTPYAFVLYGVEGGHPTLWPNVLTEESLSEVGTRYISGGHFDTMDEAREGLRFSIADSPHVEELYETVAPIDAILAPFGWDDMDDDEGYAILAKPAMAAFKELDAEGLFGTGADRDKLILMIVTEDTGKDWSKESARKLNPPKVFEAFEEATKIEGAFASSTSIALSPDGKSLYCAGSQHAPEDVEKNDDEEEDRFELRAIDLSGTTLKRRWVFDFPPFGDSIRDIACAPDSQSIVVLRAKYVGNVCQSILIRFSDKSNKPIHEKSIVGEPAGMAMSRDGSSIAISLHNQTLHLFDADLRETAVHTFDAKVHTPHFLDTGELLIPSMGGLFRLNVKEGSPPAKVRSEITFSLSTDREERLLAVSRWYSLSGPERDDPKEFGVDLFRLPTLELLRTFLVPNHQCVSGVLSPNGKLLAFQADEIGSVRKFLVVFDTDTGKEIARRKAVSRYDMVFLSDNQTLVIGTSGFTTTEPILFWKIPI